MFDEYSADNATFGVFRKKENQIPLFVIYGCA